jgi:hypothetical protein
MTAELLFEEAYELAAESLGASHLDLIPYLANLSTLYRLMYVFVYLIL